MLSPCDNCRKNSICPFKESGGCDHEFLFRWRYPTVIKAYLIGPYSGDVDANIQRAEQYAIELWRLGLAVLCPHLNTAHFEKYEDGKTLSRETWIQGDLAWMNAADVACVMPGWNNSEGSIGEVYMMQRFNRPMVFLPGLPWNDEVKKLIMEQMPDDD